MPALFAQIAQLVEQRTENPCVRGSSPRLGTTSFSFPFFYFQTPIFFHPPSREGLEYLLLF